MRTLQDLIDDFQKTNTVKAPPRNPLVSGPADLAKKLKAFLNKYETKKISNEDVPWNRYGAGHELGSLIFGESPELLDDMSYGLNPLTSGGKTGRLPTPDKRLLDMPVPLPAEGALGVIKNKGGNWLTGSVENALKGLKKRSGHNGRYSEDVLEELRREWPDEILNAVTENDGSNYVRKVMAEIQPSASLNNWIDGPLVNYIKNSMATPEDPIRLRADRLAKAAEDRLYAAKDKAFKKYPNDDRLTARTNDIRRAQERYEDEMSGILHYIPDIPVYVSDANLIRRNESNLPKEDFATTSFGKNWERTADWNTVPRTKKELYEEFGDNYDLSTYKETDPIHYLLGGAQEDLNLDHLVDEIGNALNPTSDLPNNLRLTPEDLANPRRNSMESMVDMVAKINQHRRRMAIEAEKKGNEAIRDFPDWNVVKEYPDGYRMVRLPDVADSEEAFKIGKACGEKGGWCTQGDDMLEQYGSGDSRINLLLDPEGKQVAQVETSKEIFPRSQREASSTSTFHNMFSELESAINRRPELVDEFYRLSDEPEFYDFVKKEFPDIVGRYPNPGETRLGIGQIKGKHNQKPKAEHIPYLQDFVKSGNFSDVSDLDNVDMFRNGSSYTTREDLIKEPGFVDFMIERNLNPIDDGDLGRGINYWNNNRQIGIDGI